MAKTREVYRDEQSWGQRTGQGAQDMYYGQAQDNRGINEMPSDEDVCNKQCDKWEREWRSSALAEKGLREFTGTGEGVKDGVAYTDSMYDDQVAGNRTGKR